MPTASRGQPRWRQWSRCRLRRQVWWSTAQEVRWRSSAEAEAVAAADRLPAALSAKVLLFADGVNEAPPSYPGRAGEPGNWKGIWVRSACCLRKRANRWRWRLTWCSISPRSRCCRPVCRHPDTFTARPMKTQSRRLSSAGAIDRDVRQAGVFPLRPGPLRSCPQRRDRLYHAASMPARRRQFIAAGTGEGGPLPVPGRGSAPRSVPAAPSVTPILQSGDLGRRLRRLLQAFRDAGGTMPVLLFHAGESV